jgi:hypothetical protein
MAVLEACDDCLCVPNFAERQMGQLGGLVGFAAVKLRVALFRESEGVLTGVELPADLPARESPGDYPEGRAARARFDGYDKSFAAIGHSIYQLF